MKKLVLAVSILAVLSGAASAGDLTTKAVAAPAIPSWAGFYIGGHGGYGWKDDPFSFTVSSTPLVLLNGFKSRGWVGGGQVGYNWQYGAVVGGLELDVSATGIKGNSALAIAVQPAAQSVTSESIGNDVKLLGSARGRLGFAPTSDWLLYGTGGLAWERADQSLFFSLVAPGTSFVQAAGTPVDLFGWVLGVGGEARVMRTNWVARLEYLHYDFGHSRGAASQVNVFNGATTTFINTVGNQTIDVVRAGLSYKFGG